MEDANPWRLPPSSGEGLVRDVGTLHLRQHTVDVLPLDGQFGAWPKKVVPDALHPLLFGELRPVPDDIKPAGSNDETTPLGTYALLDAARTSSLPDLLSASALDWCCLFTGKAEQTLGSVAPYLVKLEETDPFTRRLFTRSDMPDALWNATPGVFIRTTRSLAELRRNLRKFTRVQDEDGKWYYFRFWENVNLDYYTTPEGAKLGATIWEACIILWRQRSDTEFATFCTLQYSDG